MNQRTKYWLGIDGGGTKTDLQVVSASGGVLASVSLGGSNPYQQPVEEICEVLDRGRREALEMASLDASSAAEGTIICLGGLNREFRQKIAQFRTFGEIRLLNDPLAVLELCGRGGCCAIVHAGTGSFIAARDARGHHHLWGGYGHLLREPGSAWDIGRLAVARALDELAGIQPETPFVQGLLEGGHRTSSDHLIESVYGSAAPVSVLAGYAPVVMEMLDKGDLTAREIVEKSFAEFGRFSALSLSAFLAEEPSALRGISGKVFSNSGAMAIMKQVLRQNGLGESWMRIDASPIEGIRLMLVKWAAGRLPDYDRDSDEAPRAPESRRKFEEVLYERA